MTPKEKAEEAVAEIEAETGETIGSEDRLAIVERFTARIMEVESSRRKAERLVRSVAASRARNIELLEKLETAQIRLAIAELDFLHPDIH
jgi:hypothetical protein